MNKYWKRLVLLLSLFLVACSSSSDTSTENTVSPGVGIGGDVAEEDGTVRDNLVGEKVIRTVQVQFETLAYEEALGYLADLVQQHQAYVEFSNESSYSPAGSFGPEAQQFRRIEYVLRVPSEDLTDFLAGLNGMEAVKTSERLGTEDVTKTYRDSEARIEVLRQKETRLAELLEQAETIEEILLIEDQLSDTIAERESLQAQIDTIDDLIDYTEVRLNITEKQRISDARGDSIPFWTRFREAVLDSIFVFYYWLQDFIIWFIYLLPFLIVLGLLFLLYHLIARWYRKTDYAKKRAQEREQIQNRYRHRRQMREKQHLAEQKPPAAEKEAEKEEKE